MSLQVKVKDEPLDSGYGDIIASSQVKTEPLRSIAANSAHDLFDNGVQNEALSVKIKREMLDSPEQVQIKIKSEPEDFPDDFFDCLNDNNFLEEIANDQEENEEDQLYANNDVQVGRDADPKNSSVNSDVINDDDEDIENSPLREEIKKLSKKIERRKQKLALRASTLINSKSSSSKSVESTETISISTEKRIKSELGQLEKDDFDCRRYNQKENSYEKEKQKSRSRERDLRKSGRRYSEDKDVEYKRRHRSRSSSCESYSKRRRSRSRSSSRESYSKRKRSRSRSGSQSQSRDRRSRSHRKKHSSHSRYRRRTRSRSRSRSRSRIRTHSRSRSRSPYSYTRSKRSKSRSIDRDYSKSKKLSFLEELEKEFAEKGIPFPEKEQIKMMNKKDILKEYLRTETLNDPLHKKPATITSKENEITNNSNKFMPMPIQVKFEPVNKNESFPLPIQIKAEPMEECESQKEEISFPRPMIIKQEPRDIEEPIKSNFVKLRDEVKFEVPLKRRERVLNMCSEAIKKLHYYEQKKAITRFLYTPTITRQTDFVEKIENRSPLNRINNVKFKFNSALTNIDVKLYGISNLSECTTKVASIIGFDAMQIMEKLNHKDLPYSLKMLKKINNEDIKSEKFYKPFYTSTATQTDTYSCSTCIIRQLRKYHDTGVQIEPFVEDHCTQVDPQMIAEEHQKLIGSVMPIQQHYQQFYPSHNINQQQQQQQQMMYNNYVAPTGAQQTNQFMQPYPYYQGQTAMTGYGQQSPIINNMNNPMLPPSNPALFSQSQQPQQQHYAPPKSHPGPRTLPSVSSSSMGVRRNNLVIPKTSSNIVHRDK